METSKTPILPQKFDRVLIDGDILIYGICSACEYCARFDDDLDVVFCNIHEAMAMVHNTVDKFKTMSRTTPEIFFSGPGNFRKDIYPAYKANRKKVRKPAGYKAVKELIDQSLVSSTTVNIEADDAIGIVQTGCLRLGIEPLIVSEDKDFNTIPGWRYNPNKDAFVHITPEEADYNWLIQTMTGDKTDNYPGIDGVGPVTAEKILNKGGATWQTVEDAFISNGHTPEFAVSQARCARILRDGEYDWTKMEPILWQPPAKS
jgi:DNA polymerase-1